MPKLLIPAMPELFQANCPEDPIRSFLFRDSKSTHHLEEKKLGEDIGLELIDSYDK